MKILSVVLFVFGIASFAEAGCQIIFVPDGRGGTRSCQVCTWPNGQTSTTCG